MPRKLVIMIMLFIPVLALAGNDRLVSHRLRGAIGKAWDRASSISVSDSSISPNTMTVRSVWDRDSLYFRFDVLDSNLWALQTERDHKILYQDDMCEVLLDCDNDHSGKSDCDDRIYHINLNCTVKDDCGTDAGVSDKDWDGRETFRVLLRGSLNDSSDVDEGYTIFLAIPWTDLGRKARPGLVMGMNTAFSDRCGAECERKMVLWRPAALTRDTSTFGELLLVR